MRLAVVLAATVVVVVGIRPANVPGQRNFRDSSTMDRVIMGAAGIDIFLHHPIFGVGFSRSSLPAVLADPSVTSDLHQWFPNASDDLFPTLSNCLVEHQLTGAEGVSSSCDVGSASNAYVQVAAEEGLIGLVTLVAVALVIRRRVRSVREQTTDPTILATLRWATLVLIVVLIWWNDNPLYGAHPETLLAALALGTLAVPWSSLRDDPGGVSVRADNLASAT